VQTGARALLGRRRVSLRRLADFYRQLADLLVAGVPLLKGLDVLAKLTKDPLLARALQGVREEVTSGRPLAEAMSDYSRAFSRLHCAMVRAGEQGGFLPEVLKRIARFQQRQADVRAKVLGAMIYPAFLIGVGAMVVIGLLIFIVPRFVDHFAGRTLPLPTRMLLGASEIILDYWPILLLTLGLLILGLQTLWGSRVGQEWLDRQKVRFPVIGPIFRLTAICRFSRILGTLLANGVGMIESLRVSRDSIGNHVLAERIDEAREAVQSGKPLAEPLEASGLFPADLVQMIAVGEESNRLDAVLVEMSDTQEERLTRLVDGFVRLFEPVLLLALAGVVFFVAVALLLPILTMSAMVR